MSNRAEVRDLEDSLPYYISKHLGERLYMNDEVNQLPISLREDPPKESSFWDDFSDHREDPEMVIRSPLEKEHNVMAQGDLDHLRETYFFPIRIQARILEEGETILSTHPRGVTFYEAVFPAGLRFPIHPTIKRFLNFYNICPPNSPTTRDEVSSTCWWYGDFIGSTFPLTSLGALTPCLKVRSQTQGGSISRRGSNQR